MGKIIKAERGGGGVQSKVIEEYTPLGNVRLRLCLLLRDAVTGA